MIIRISIKINMIASTEISLLLLLIFSVDLEWNKNLTVIFNKN
jgi:hypothetical protein